jgi:hypothetical protein
MSIFRNEEKANLVLVRVLCCYERLSISLSTSAPLQSRTEHVDQPHPADDYLHSPSSPCVIRVQVATVISISDMMNGKRRSIIFVSDLLRCFRRSHKKHVVFIGFFSHAKNLAYNYHLWPNMRIFRKCFQSFLVDRLHSTH